MKTSNFPDQRVGNVTLRSLIEAILEMLGQREFHFMLLRPRILASTLPHLRDDQIFRMSKFESHGAGIPMNLAMMVSGLDVRLTKRKMKTRTNEESG